MNKLISLVIFAAAAMFASFGAQAQQQQSNCMNAPRILSTVLNGAWNYKATNGNNSLRNVGVARDAAQAYDGYDNCLRAEQAQRAQWEAQTMQLQTMRQIAYSSESTAGDVRGSRNDNRQMYADLRGELGATSPQQTRETRETRVAYYSSVQEADCGSRVRQADNGKYWCKF